MEETVPGNAAGNYTILRTFTATDDAGNATTLVQTITVQDTTAPVLTIPADYTAECTDVLVYDDASATDNCGSIEIVLVEDLLQVIARKSTRCSGPSLRRTMLATQPR